MTQERIIELLARKLAAEATKDELNELADLMNRYPDALYYDEVFQQLWKAEPKAEPLNDIFEKHKAKYSSEFPQGETTVKAFGRIRSRYAILVSVLIILMGSGVYFFSLPGGASPGKMMEISAGKGVRKKLTLPDGTQVWLNSNSKLVYDSEMNEKDTRSVKLYGEAYFDVTKNKERPFIIGTDKFSIKVLGTAFNVKAYPNEKKAEATLIHGMIELSLTGKQEQKIILKPNEKFALSESSDKIGNIPPGMSPRPNRKLIIERVIPVEVEGTEYVEEVAWIENTLVLSNDTFEELIPRLEEWYNIKIIFKKEAIKSFHFTGVFEGESIEEALRALQSIKPFKFKIKRNEIEIY